MHELRRLLRFVRPYSQRAALALAMLVTVVAFDLALPRLIQHVIDAGIVARDQSTIVKTSLAMLAISALSAVFSIANNNFSVEMGEGVARDLREAVFVHIQKLSFGDLDRLQTGVLLVRLTSDVGAIKALTMVSLRIGTRAPLLMLGSLALMVSTSASLALTMVPLLVVTSILIGFFVVRMEPLFRTVQERLDTLNAVLQEIGRASCRERV